MFRKTFLLLAVVVACRQPLPATAQTTPPDERTTRFVAAFNSGEASRIRNFLQRELVPERLGDVDDIVAGLTAQRSKMGPLVVAATDRGPRRTVAHARTEKSEWYDVILVGGPADKLRRVAVALGLPPMTKAATRDAAALPPILGPYLNAIAAKGYFSGVVLLAHDGAEIFSGAYGQADRVQKASNTIDTRFNIASIGKLFTIVAIHQLEEAGKLSDSDTLGKWLPDYPNAAAKAATIRQLLDMQSGIGDFFGPRFAKAPRDQFHSLADYLPFFAGDPLAFAPGTDSLYSNGGFIVLGLIVERASGEDYYTYVQRHVFGPAGMTQTGFRPLDEPDPLRAKSYSRDWEDAPTWATPLHAADDLGPLRGTSAGGVYSTAGDLLKFTRALAAGTLLARRYDRLGPGNAAAGGTPGWNAILVQERNDTLIVLSNQDPPVAEDVGDMLAPYLERT